MFFLSTHLTSLPFFYFPQQSVYSNMLRSLTLGDLYTYETIEERGVERALAPQSPVSGGPALYLGQLVRTLRLRIDLM